ncbi:toll/interleukin-1 receptor domain-containing protein [Prevotella sp. 10(H)]|uniref:toll/interleukin-1 receptor domain-containing protein n=1 Tax=Prevotella sp. 10(H) TaxID=1158294 RepID=UPI0004A6B70A|nr:toll/interleukin-1 receptor domain-containing protein [Prevotella sp. 10(H)]
MDRIEVKVKIFVSYCHRDRRWVSSDSTVKLKNDPNSERSLIEHINRYISQKAEIWVDHNLIGGDDFTPIIKQKITDAQIVILIITEDFSFSNYILNEELPYIENRYKNKKTEVIPLLVSPLSNNAREELTKLLKGHKTLINETDDLDTLFHESKYRYDKALNDIVDKISAIVEKCHKEKTIYELAKRDTRNMEACDQYLAEYPEGRFVEEIQQLKKEIVKSIHDEKLFREVIATESIDNYEEFLKHQQDSKYYALVKKVYLGLKDKLKEEEESDFHTLEDNNPRMFYDFIVKYPDSKYKEDVSKRIKYIEKQEYKNLPKKPTLELLEEFLERHPTGNYVNDIQGRIDRIHDFNNRKDDANFRYACNKNTIEAYDDYIYEGGKWVEQAEKAKNKLIKEETTLYKVKHFLYRGRYILIIALAVLLPIIGYQIYEANKTLPLDNGADINYSEYKMSHELNPDRWNSNLVNGTEGLNIQNNFNYIESETDTVMNKAIQLCKSSYVKDIDTGKKLLYDAALNDPLAMYNMAIFEHKNKGDCMTWLEKAAGKGFAEAQYLKVIYPLRNNLYLRNLTTNEIGQIIRNLEIPSSNGHGEATYIIAKLYSQLGNKDKMLEKYHLGVEQTSTKSIINLVHYYDQKKDYSTTFKILSDVVSKHPSIDDPKIRIILAKSYFLGYGCKKDTLEAYRIINKGYDLNGSSSLSDIQAAMRYNGEGCQSDAKTAFDLLYSRSANRRHSINVDDVFHLGLMYYNGKGTTQNMDSAISCFNRIVTKEKSYSHQLEMFYVSHFMLGKLYMNIDQAKSLHHLEEAATYGDNKNAWNLLGCMYLQGSNGVKKDTKRGMDYLRKAIEKKSDNDYFSVEALFNIGLIYYYGGYGVKKDKVMGEDYLRRAAKHRHSKAQKTIKEMYS